MWYISFCHFQRFLQRSHQKPQVRRAATICLVQVAIFLPSQSCPGSPWSKSPAGLTLHFPENQTTPPPSHVFVKRNLKSSRSSLPTQRAWGIPQAPFCSSPCSSPEAIHHRGNPPSKPAFVIFRAGMGASQCRKTTELRRSWTSWWSSRSVWKCYPVSQKPKTMVWCFKM